MEGFLQELLMVLKQQDELNAADQKKSMLDNFNTVISIMARKLRLPVSREISCLFRGRRRLL